MTRGLAWVHVICGGVGLAAAVVLILEKIAKLRDPAYMPSCSLNPVVSCESVMDSVQAEAFGFPNPLVGVVGFTVVVTSGVAVLTGFTPPRWYRIALSVGAALGVLFVHWLIAVSLYKIQALCLYCIVVWIVTISLFWYTALDTWPVLAPLRRVHSAVLALWYAIIAALVLAAFWEYWTSLL